MDELKAGWTATERAIIEQKDEFVSTVGTAMGQIASAMKELTAEIRGLRRDLAARPSDADEEAGGQAAS